MSDPRRICPSPKGSVPYLGVVFIRALALVLLVNVHVCMAKAELNLKGQRFRSRSAPPRAFCHSTWREDFVWTNDVAKFRHSYGGIAGTNHADDGIWTIVFYSRNGRQAVVARATLDSSQTVHVSPFVDSLKKESTHVWTAVDVGGGPGTAAAIEKFLGVIGRSSPLRTAQLGKRAPKRTSDERK